MPAYSRPYMSPRCPGFAEGYSSRGCNRLPTHEVHDAWHRSRGYYCEKHAQAYVEFLNMPLTTGARPVSAHMERG